MSLLLDQTIPTPCPAPRYPQSLKALHTPQLGLKIAPSRGIKPRRVAKGGAAGWDPTLDIFDEVAGDDMQNTDVGPALRVQETAAQRHGTVVNSANIRKRRTSTLASPRIQPPRADSVTVDLKFTHTSDIPGASTEKTDEIKKARRRTIYIPSEDTTMLTIHPGASLREQARRPRGSRRSDIFLDLAALSEEDGTGSDKPVSAQEQGQAQGRAIGAAPRRAPLVSTQNARQVNGVSQDVAGTGGGKENLPPGWTAGSTKKNASLIKPKRILEAAGIVKPRGCASIQTRPIHQLLDTRPQHAKSKLSNATSVMSSPISPQKQSPRTVLSPNTRPRWNSGSSPASRSVARTSDLGQNIASLKSDTDPHSIVQSTKVQPHRSPRFASRRDLPSALIQPATERYRVLREGIAAMPALYTSEYLTSQEIAISQVINDIFLDAGHGGQMAISYAVIRKEMMCLHNTENTVQLQQRLQASLRFGALSISKMALEKVNRIKDDLAQRQGFLDLWMKTYDLDLLQAAAEVTVGREISKTARISSSPRSSIQTVSTEASSTQRQTKAVQAFLRTFLLRNEDAPKSHGSPLSARISGKTVDDNDDMNAPAWLWRRTVVRSLLLIRLLDQFAATKTSTFNDVCLFQKSSPYKSSANMLQAIGSLLIPSGGDPTRTLNHHNYTVSHVQHALQEYNYRVTNPAIDFRDGMLLTRLIEIVFLKESASVTSGVSSNIQHHLTSTLHCPAPTRTHKLHNARIALSAANDLSQRKDNALSDTLATLKPEDIVDGHREKTLALLWALMVDCGGLETLIPRNMLVKAVERLCMTTCSDNTSVDNIQHDQASTQDLLSEWARQCATYHSIALPSRQDIMTHLTNPNTRNTIYEAVVTTYSDSEDLAQTLKRVAYYDSKFVALYSISASASGEIDLHTKETSVALLALLAKVLLMT